MNLDTLMQANGWRSIMTVDPGKHTGIVMIRRGDPSPAFRTLNCPEKMGTEAKSHWWLIYYFREALREMEPDKVFIESPEYWGGSETSAASAGSGSLFILDRIAGGFGAVCTLDETPWDFLPVHKWKGQLTKEATDARIRRARPELILPNSHVRDAFAMTLALGGEL
jgi:hypothetical protein